MAQHKTPTETLNMGTPSDHPVQKWEGQGPSRGGRISGRDTFWPRSLVLRRNFAGSGFCGLDFRRPLRPTLLGPTALTCRVQTTMKWSSPLRLTESQSTVHFSPFLSLAPHVVVLDELYWRSMKVYQGISERNAAAGEW